MAALGGCGGGPGGVGRRAAGRRLLPTRPASVDAAAAPRGTRGAMGRGVQARVTVKVHEWSYAVPSTVATMCAVYVAPATSGAPGSRDAEFSVSSDGGSRYTKPTRPVRPLTATELTRTVVHRPKL